MFGQFTTLPINLLLFNVCDTSGHSRSFSIMAMNTNGETPSANAIERGNKLLAEMESFATGAGCRRRCLLKYFGEDMGEGRRREDRVAHLLAS